LTIDDGEQVAYIGFWASNHYSGRTGPMTIYGIVLFQKYGIPIYTKLFKQVEKRTWEVLVAAIDSLANEAKLGQMTHVEFENATIIFLTGMVNKEITLALIVDNPVHQDYIIGMYLLNKIEKELKDMKDFVTDYAEKIVDGIFSKYLHKLIGLSDFLGECFAIALDSLGPGFYESIMLYLYNHFGVEPLIAMMRSPVEFIRKLDEILQPENTDFLFFSLIRVFCNKYIHVCEDLNINEASLKRYAREITRYLRQNKEEVAKRMFRDLIERVIDLMIVG